MPPAVWPALQLSQLRQSLREVETLVARPPGGLPDDVMRALTRFLVVRSCGYLEQVVEECFKAYVTAHSDVRVRSFVTTSWRRGTNPTPGTLTELLARLDPAWSDQLGDLLGANDERLHRSLKNLVATRNKVAHGSSEQVRVRTALDFASDAVEVADWFTTRFVV